MPPGRNFDKNHVIIRYNEAIKILKNAINEDILLDENGHKKLIEIYADIINTLKIDMNKRPHTRAFVKSQDEERKSVKRFHPAAR